MSTVISPEQIKLDLALTSKAAAFDEICSIAAVQGITTDPLQLRKDLEFRESLQETGMMDGFAIPHAKSEAVSHAAIVFIRSKQPIPWETMDGSDVTKLFALLVPAHQAGTVHLEMLSTLATCLLDEPFKQFVSEQTDAQAICDHIVQSIDTKE